ncbi:MAG: hypothetical protein HFG05_13045 [Oscillibacter sp.]|nr:hypothetical protein [Oscillibacter sp.]
MNIILEERPVSGLWLLKVQAPSGQLICVNHKGTLAEAREKAMMAEPEPA